MEIKVTLRRNSDGEVRDVPYDILMRDGTQLNADVVEYMWLDGGNYSCDCNRHLFFERASGHDPAWNEHGCSDGEYNVLKIVMPDGTVIEGEE